MSADRERDLRSRLLWALLAAAFTVLAVWANRVFGSLPPGDHYDEQAVFFIEGLIRLAVLFCLWKAIR